MLIQAKFLFLIAVITQLILISASNVQDTYVCPKVRPTDCSNFKGGPACAYSSQIRCIRAPCMQEFNNSCEACANKYVTSIVCGKCSDMSSMTPKYQDIPNKLKLPLCLPLKQRPNYPIKAMK